MSETIGRSEVGLYRKFSVERKDGRSAEGEKHHGCEYFVLDLNHDPFAYAAITTYARKCSDKYPELAADLLRKAREMSVWMVEQHVAELTPEQHDALYRSYWEGAR